MIGRYTERVSVQTVSVTNNGGTPVPTATTVLSRIAARVESGGGRAERVFGSQVQAETAHVVSFPAPTDDVELTGQIVWHHRHGDRTLQIVGKVLRQDARVRELALACAEARTA